MPYYTGLAELCSMRKTVCQLIVGQLKGIKKRTNQEIQYWYRKHGIDPKVILARCGGRQHAFTTDDQNEVANVVTTSGEKRQRLKRLRHEQLLFLAHND